MKQFGMFMLAAVCVAAIGCGSDSPSSPSTNNPTTVTFTAQLRPSNEVPAVSGPESSGTGNATITLHLTRDGSGAIQSGTMDFQFSLSGFPAGTNIVAAHIHPAATGTNGPILIPVTGISAGTPLALVNGSGSFQVNGVAAATDAATLQSMVDTPGNFYFNVHSSSNPGGVARGQLVKQ